MAGVVLLGEPYEGAIPSCLKLSTCWLREVPFESALYMQGAFIMLKFSDCLFADVI